MPRVAKFAKALLALHQAGMLNDRDCRPAIGMFVRQATETSLWHLTSHYRSIRAAEAIAAASHIKTSSDYHNWCRQNLRHGHMVPVSVVICMLIKAPQITEEFVARTLRENGLRATIHRDEDEKLNKLGLGKKMPDSFWTEGSPYFNDPLARYKEAELFSGLVPLAPGNSWYP